LLHAQRAGNFAIEHWETQAIGDSDSKEPRLQKTILAVDLRGHGSDVGASVRARDAKQALLLAIVRSRVDQILVHLFVKA